MDPALHALLLRLDALPELGEVRDGIRRAVRIADEDPEMALTRARKVLEFVVREVYERRCQEPPGTRPLENLLQRLLKEGHLPARLDAYANAIRMLGNVGTHRFGEAISTADVQHSLSQLVPVVDWYVQVERPAATAPPGRPELEPAKRNSSAPTPTARPVTRAVMVPKGLRSFDAADADFFLDLLPGPRDRTGLPESIRFWKHALEEAAGPAFTVGVLYGPSGCGKSSLVKAGLLPRLGNRILPALVEATAKDTEVRLLGALRKRYPGLPADLGLAETVAALRREQGLGRGRKVLIVLDQFEQWLHAQKGEEDTELARALRQCDGERVQALLLVRDDFWLGLSRFLGELNIELLQGQNSALVDLFDPRHARAVLAAFGRAFGTVDEPASAELQAFLDRAVEGLAEDGRVVPVRLALFAEMVKARPWSPATLKAVGGAAGVGVAFLEETFGSHAQAKHRLHQEAARAVLRALLPEQGTDIKGQMQSRAKLLRAAGYAERPRDFDDLLRLLDGELRLITPTEPPVVVAEGERYYQLTHDYLVPALREWLVRKQRETWRGRAELRLAERTTAWAVKPETRHLPAWWEWLDIRLLTRKRDWTPAQRKMMRRAARLHLIRGSLAVAALALVVLAGLLVWGQEHAEALVKRVLVADTAQVPGIVAEMKGYRPLVDPLLRAALAREPEGSKERLHASLALLPDDPGQADFLYQRLLGAAPAEVLVLRDALRDNGAVREGLWAVLADDKAEAGPRFRAACALADYELTDEEAARWQAAAPFVAGQLLDAVQKDPASYPAWLALLRPQRDGLAGPLQDAFRQYAGSENARPPANILADYFGDRPGLLAGLVPDADEKQFAVLLPKLQGQPDQALPVLRAELARPVPRAEEEKERLAKRQANAAVALLRLGEPEPVWALFQFHPDKNPDPRLRSYLIHRLSPLGADAKAIVKRLAEEPDVSAKRALLLGLGEFTPEQLPPAERNALVPALLTLYQEDPDPGLHGAADWLLRRWQQAEKLREIDRALAAGKVAGQRRWYVNGQGQTMVVIRGPVEFRMGSPPTEAGRQDGPEGKAEEPHRVRIGRSFAIAARDVTVAQFLQFRNDYDYDKKYAPKSDCPVNTVSWYEAAAYCNWLSRREGLPECYLPNDHEEYAEGMGVKPDYLRLTGYRLPTEAEWEYACRAGAVTSRYYGETEELLGKYAWYLTDSSNRMWPVGGLKPNDLGLFDMLGNALQWCHDPSAYYQPGEGGRAREDQEFREEDIKGKQYRALRGGAFTFHAGSVRCANRIRYAPDGHNYGMGFRPARTYR